MSKPAYRIPTMAEIEALPWNGFNVVSTFSGGGGSCLGYRMAGYRVLYANEFIEEAQRTYKANHPNSFLDTRDIRQVKASDILDKINLKAGELDIFDGSPPCASFSTSGARDKGWGKVKNYSDKTQRTDDLFYEYARLLRELQPKVFIAENVSGLIKGTAKGYFLQILAVLKAAGYKVKAAGLNASLLGVPQTRERLIFVGVRDDLGIAPVHPAPYDYTYRIAEVLPHIVAMKYGGSSPRRWRTAAHNVAPTVVASGGSISPTATFSGGSYVRAKTDANGVLRDTVIERRATIDEIRVLCSFPSDFVLTGSFEQQWERMGRSVPPLMMRAVATTVREKILKQI